MKAKVHLEVHLQAQAGFDTWLSSIDSLDRQRVVLGLKNYLQKVAPKLLPFHEGVGQFEWEYAGATFHYDVFWKKIKFLGFWIKTEATVAIMRVELNASA